MDDKKYVWADWISQRLTDRSVSTTHLVKMLCSPKPVDFATIVDETLSGTLSLTREARRILVVEKVHHVMVPAPARFISHLYELGQLFGYIFRQGFLSVDDFDEEATGLIKGYIMTHYHCNLGRFPLEALSIYDQWDEFAQNPLSSLFDQAVVFEMRQTLDLVDEEIIGGGEVFCLSFLIAKSLVGCLFITTTIMSSLPYEIQQCIRLVVSYLPADDGSAIKPELLHAIRVGMHLYEWRETLSREVILAGFLHDLIEEGVEAGEVIREQRGEYIYSLVLANSKDQSITDKELKLRDINRRCAEIGFDALIIKLADVYDNITYVDDMRLPRESQLARAVLIGEDLMTYSELYGEHPLYGEFAELVEGVR